MGELRPGLQQRELKDTPSIESEGTLFPGGKEENRAWTIGPRRRNSPAHLEHRKDALVPTHRMAAAELTCSNPRQGGMGLDGNLHLHNWGWWHGIFEYLVRTWAETPLVGASGAERLEC